VLCTVAAAQALPDRLEVTPGLYRITARTVLPHLEENLRNAVVVEQLCLGASSAASLFPLLRHEAFAGCMLNGRALRDGAQAFVLTCANREAASGQARLVESPALLEGVLDVKMGGKNMTLAQRVRAERLGACP
jgi:hypothetical protein